MIQEKVGESTHFHVVPPVTDRILRGFWFKPNRFRSGYGSVKAFYAQDQFPTRPQRLAGELQTARIVQCFEVRRCEPVSYERN